MRMIEDPSNATSQEISGTLLASLIAMGTPKRRIPSTDTDYWSSVILAKKFPESLNTIGMTQESDCLDFCNSGGHNRKNVVV